MSEQDLHLMLWQKRNELPVTDDVQHDWQNMQAMLDTHIPIGNPPAGAGGLSGLSGIKLLSVLLVSLAVATLVYFTIVKTKNTGNAKSLKTIVAKHKNGGSTNSMANSAVDSFSHTSPPVDVNNSTVASPNTGNTKTSSAVPNNTSNSGSTNSAAAVKSVPGDINIPKTTNGLPGNNTNASVNSHPDKASSGGAKANNGHTIAASGSSTLPTHIVLTHANNHSLKSGPNANLGNKLAKKSSAQPSTLNHNLNDRVNHTGRSNLVKNPGTNTRHRAGGTDISGAGALRRGRGHHQNSNNILSKLNGKGSSPKGKTPNLPGSSDTAQNASDPLTALDKNNPANTIVDAPDKYLTDALQAKFIPEVFAPTKLSSAFADKFKDDQNANNTNKNTVNKPSTNKSSKVDWGILAGVNTAGSFTAKSQNANFYGSLPVDVFFGLFATYNFSDRWGVNLGVRGLNPQNISGTYNHANESKKDTLQTLNMSDSRKVYFADVPINMVFKPTPYLSLKAGPVFSIPLKQANGISTFQTGKLKKDSLYYVGVTKTINATTYTQSINTGLTFGASLQTGRFIFDGAYVQGLTGLSVGSGLGSYTANSSYFLFTVGFKLNKGKK